MKVKEMCEKYYPKLWSKERLQTLVRVGRLSEADYKEITGEDYVVEA